MTTINFTKVRMPVSKTFNSHDAAYRYFLTEAKKLEVRQKALGLKCPETRAILQEDKENYVRIAVFFKNLLILPT